MDKSTVVAGNSDDLRQIFCGVHQSLVWETGVRED